ncbi:hypothetical protein [Qingshengfaniella alkalisoli]|uniref:PepSY domain-containing protein n=1 Tax=Qingshengfaniella alkalisoli TaxID=2599296 RepID=A0A5B8IB00_9RHOB|nr:hypothetical protein [Qingshengfaniella alkalisoli]QDY71269.1 hypothetical protein FPZ52_16415 [Qingshengfaniella alkalisoli]
MKTTTYILIATLAGFSVTGALAQSKTPADHPFVKALGLEQITERHHYYGDDLHGVTADGVPVEIEFDRDGEIEEVDVESREGLPISAVSSLIPQAVLEHDQFPVDAHVKTLDIDDRDKIEIEGYLANGQEFEAEFTFDGRLLELDIDD